MWKKLWPPTLYSEQSEFTKYVPRKAGNDNLEGNVFRPLGQERVTNSKLGNNKIPNIEFPVLHSSFLIASLPYLDCGNGYR
jgi:hypothetical protein